MSTFVDKKKKKKKKKVLFNGTAKQTSGAKKEKLHCHYPIRNYFGYILMYKTNE